MPHHWPEDTDFALLELDVLDRNCPFCGHMMYICDHRHRHVFTLDAPLQVLLKGCQYLIRRLLGRREQAAQSLTVVRGLVPFLGKGLWRFWRA